MPARRYTGAMPETDTTLQDRYRGALLGLAVGNTLGLPVEAWPKETIRQYYPNGIREIDPLELSLPWDDDLAQAVIIAEAILEHDTLDNDDLAARLLDWFEKNGRGMGSQTRAVLNALRAGMMPSEAARLVWEEAGTAPAGNGAVMRCAPIAMRWRLDSVKLREETENSSRITHHDPRCGWSAYAVNLAIADALNGRTATIESIAATLEVTDVSPITVQFARGASGRQLDDLQLERTMGYTLKAMQVGLWCLERGTDFEESLVAVIEAGGDTDTNGAVAGAVLGALHGAGAIPPRWIGGVARAERLTAIADQLLARAEEKPDRSATSP
jgi:ADP-ribosyl-[dinitrogen reductase] hydrolase